VFAAQCLTHIKVDSSQSPIVSSEITGQTQRGIRSVIDLDEIRDAVVTHKPFDFFVASTILNDTDLAKVHGDFPDIEKPGVYPLSALECGPAFTRLIEEIRSDELVQIVGMKLGVDLVGLPMMIAVRGYVMTDADRVRAFVIERLMCDPAYRADELRERFGAVAEPLIADVGSLVAAADDGLFEPSGNGFLVPEKGRPFLGSISACLDAHLDAKPFAFSAGV